MQMLCDAGDEALYSIPAAADEMPPPQATYGEPRGPSHRGLSQVPLLVTTGNDMSSKESVDMPMEAMTHPAVQKVCSCSHPSGRHDSIVLWQQLCSTITLCLCTALYSSA